MSSKTLGYILVAAGIILLIIGIFADPLGLGGAPGFGWKQILATLAGVIAVIAGVLLALRKA